MAKDRDNFKLLHPGPGPLTHTHSIRSMEYRWLPGDAGDAPASNVDVHGAFRITFNTPADNTAVRISHLAISW